MQTHEDQNRPRRRRLNKAVMNGIALVGVGAIAGGIASATVSAGAATPTTTTAASGSAGAGGSSTTSSPPAGSGRQRPTAPPGAAALPLHGTVTAVSASSVTIKTSSGTTTYAVTAMSDIEKNGKTGSSALSAGDVVAFSTVTTDGSTAIDKLVAGGGPGAMAGGCGPGGAGGKSGTAQGPPTGAGASESAGGSGIASGATGTASSA
jgi:hypothetical protein